jgi:hypothetical protein
MNRGRAGAESVEGKIGGLPPGSHGPEDVLETIAAAMDSSAGAVPFRS